MSITVRAPAKINLHLGVGAPRPDGFHPLVTVYQAIGLYDDVTATAADAWSIHTVATDGIDLATVPDDAENIAVRAGIALVAHHGRSDLAAHLEVHKGIPVAGGMAGGSADAAAALVAIDRLFDLNTTDEDLVAIAATLGSDVPFALYGATALGTGRGEIVDPVASTGNGWWIVIPNSVGLSTPAVYRHYDELIAAGDVVPDDGTLPSALLAAVAAGDTAALRAVLRNDLAAAAYSLRPDLVELATQIRESADLDSVLLSGSGPTLLALVDSAEQARSAAAALREAGLTPWIAPAPVAGAHVVTIDE